MQFQSSTWYSVKKAVRDYLHLKKCGYKARIRVVYRYGKKAYHVTGVKTSIPIFPYPPKWALNSGRRNTYKRWRK